MIKEFLNSCFEDLIEKKINFENELKDIEGKRRESLVYLNILQSQDEDEKNIFSPRERETANREKINFLNETLDILAAEEAEISRDLESVISKMEDVENSIRDLVDKEKNQVEEIQLDNEIFRLKMLETQEFERQRIARDLHDSTVQNLTNLVHRIELCNKLVDLDLTRCRLELKSMDKAIREVIDGMRSVIYNLRPMSFDDMGIDVTIEREIARLQKNGGIPINYFSDGDFSDLKSVISLTLLRVVQEACNNAIKHSEAKSIDVHFLRDDKYVEVIVKDDGVGFVFSEICNDDDLSSGFGLSMMKERIYLLSGEINIKSRKDGGTIVYVKVPVNIKPKHKLSGELGVGE